jgi:predicted hydrocarbon binding protein
MEKTENSGDETVSAFGYELLKNVLIPELLGEEQSSILYWAGKNLARKYPLESTDEIAEFFRKAGWGDLTVDTEGKNKITFSLTSKLITRQLKQHKTATFALETGFVAQQIQTIKNRLADATSSVRKKRTVTITVEWDHKDVIHKTTDTTNSPHFNLGG